jgi:hypothetical protein
MQTYPIHVEIEKTKFCNLLIVLYLCEITVTRTIKNNTMNATDVRKKIEEIRNAIESNSYDITIEGPNNIVKRTARSYDK